MCGGCISPGVQTVQYRSTAYRLIDSTSGLDSTRHNNITATNNMDPQVKVGVGVFVLNPDGNFVIGKRQGSVGAGTWALPGGHLEFGESFEICAEREVLEETGLKITDVHFLTAVNSVMEDENKHYVTIFMGAYAREKEDPKVLEPEKCETWEWISWDQMKAGVGEGWNLFMPLSELFKQRPEFRV